jgi:hypothetical protein
MFSMKRTAAGGLICTLAAICLMTVWATPGRSWPAPQRQVIHDTTEIMIGDTAQFVALWNDSTVTLMCYHKIDSLGYDYLTMIRWPGGGFPQYHQVVDSLIWVLGVAPEQDPAPALHFDLNPFNPGNTIRFTLPFRSHVRLVIFDVQGRLVRTLVNGALEAGPHEATFDASRLASGMYFVKMQAGNFSAVKKMMLVK